MSSDNKWERLFKLWTNVARLVVDGKRDLDKVIDFLQDVVSEKVFVVKDNFVVNTSREAIVKIRQIGDEFEECFLNTIEEIRSTSESTFFVLPESMKEKEIIDRLGGVTNSAFSLNEMFRLMQNQPSGPKSKAGKLATDGSINIFFIPQLVKKINGNNFSYKDLNGDNVEEDSQYLFEVGGRWYVLRIVYVYWSVNGWEINASDLGFSRGTLSSGIRVFSKALKSSEVRV